LGVQAYEKEFTFCGAFGVSRSVAAIRLEQLGYLNRKKDYEYRDPLEVWP
jgi:Zn-dependent peptidase ImmA (M78 family)